MRGSVGSRIMNVPALVVMLESAPALATTAHVNATLVSSGTETRTLVGLFNEIDPHLFVDLHNTAYERFKKENG